LTLQIIWRMNIYLKTKIILLYYLLSSGCKEAEPHIVIFCQHCKGCVQNALLDIEENELDKKFKIYTDSNCIDSRDLLQKIQFVQLDDEELHRKFGDFVNIGISLSDEDLKILKTNERLTDYLIK